MADNNDKDNIIDFFKRTQRGLQNAGEEDAAQENSALQADGARENILKAEFFKHFPYIKLTKDNNGNYLQKELILEYAEKIAYIVTVVRDDKPSCAMYRYIVPQKKLTEFLNVLKKDPVTGVLADIEKYIPEDSA